LLTAIEERIWDRRLLKLLRAGLMEQAPVDREAAQFFDKIASYALARIAAFVAKRHQRTRVGWWAVVYRSRTASG
jgi:hypothetical protein